MCSAERGAEAIKRRRYRTILNCVCSATGELFWEEDEVPQMEEQPVNPLVVELKGPFVVIDGIKVACIQCSNPKPLLR